MRPTGSPAGSRCPSRTSPATGSIFTSAKAPTPRTKRRPISPPCSRAWASCWGRCTMRVICTSMKSRATPMASAGCRRSGATSPASSRSRRSAKRRDLPSNDRLRQGSLRGTKDVLERLPERDVDVREAQGMAEIDQRCYAKAGVGDAAGYDRREVRKVRFDIDGDTVERHPALEPHADRGDLVLKPFALVRPFDPDADAVLAPFAAHVEASKRADDPFLKAGHIGADVRPPPFEIKHHIGHALTRTVIDELAAAAGLKNRKPGVQQVSGFAASAGGIERGVFQEPDQFRRLARRDRSDALLHRCDRVRIGHRRIRNAPFHRAAGGLSKGRQIKALAIINHWLTITW